MNRVEIRSRRPRTRARDDLYYWLVTRSWGHLMAMAALAYAGLNVVFGLLYCLGDSPIANARPGSFGDAFFFSVQAFSTIGFGSMYPQTLYGHVLVTVQTFLGLLAVATLTGLVFSKFSLPTAKVRFADRPVVSRHDGVPTLQLRLANVRENQIHEATVSVVMLIDRPTEEGQSFRRILDLPLVRNRTPTFTLGWTLLHPIDEASPMYGLDAAALEAGDVTFQVTLSGTDGSLSQYIHARHTFAHEDLAWGHRYADIVAVEPDGSRVVDLDRFDEIEEVE